MLTLPACQETPAYTEKQGKKADKTFDPGCEDTVEVTEVGVTQFVH